MDQTKPLALITGASAGIGAAFARRLAQDGFGLILVARRRDRLEELARELKDAEVLTADLADDAGMRLVESRIDAEPRLELLINNAGFGTKRRFFDAAIEGQDQMHRLHVLATMRLSHAALRGMVARRKGAVINVSSVAAYGISPGNTSYCSTKAWMNAFTEGLAVDLRSANSPVRVQALCPGYTITEFHDVLQIERQSIPGARWMTAESVVDASLAGLQRGKLFVVPGLFYKAVVKAELWMPVSLRMWVALRYSKALGRNKGAPER
jgi:uncharacterized protein